MEYRVLGNTEIKVSRLCFGSLTLGPIQANLSIDEGSTLLLEAFDRGINFIDTAEIYKNYSHIKEALKRTDKDIIIASRSYAYTREMAKESIEKARREMDRDVIDIFGLHEQESENTMRGHREALEYIIEAKQKGIIRAVLITTHNIEVVKLISKMPEIDVVHPLLNKTGIGIGDGSPRKMLEAIEHASSMKKGIYSMKPFGGGNLIRDYKECLNYVLENPYINSIAIGMKNIDELEMNVDYFNGNYDIEQRLEKTISNKSLHIEYWCENCGACINRCKQKALSQVNGKITVDKSKCLLCGYCAVDCPAFAIKII